MGPALLTGGQPSWLGFYLFSNRVALELASRCICSCRCPDVQLRCTDVLCVRVSAVRLYAVRSQTGVTHSLQPRHHTTTAPQHCGVTDCCVLCHNSATPQQQHQHQHQQERSGHYITLPCPLSTDPMFTVSKHLTKEVDTSKNLFILINFRSDILGAVHKLRDRQSH